MLNTLQLKEDRRKDFRACKRHKMSHKKCQSQDCYMNNKVSQAKYAKSINQILRRNSGTQNSRNSDGSMFLRCVPGTVPSTVGTCRSLCHARRPSSSSVKANRGVAKDLHTMLHQKRNGTTLLRRCYDVVTVLLRCYQKRKDENDERVSKSKLD